MREKENWVKGTNVPHFALSAAHFPSDGFQADGIQAREIPTPQ